MYIATHFNLAGYNIKSTKERKSRYKEVIEWIIQNQSHKGIISLSPLLIGNLLWEQESLLHDISKFRGNKQMELAATTYSNYIPLFKDYEESILLRQINESISVLKRVFGTNHDIITFYSPFSVWDKRLVPILENNGYRYVLVDWFTLQQFIPKARLDNLPRQCLRPYRLKDSNLIILPSLNIHSIFQLFPKGYTQYIKTGELNKFINYISDEIRKMGQTYNEYYITISLNINDIYFPYYGRKFDFENFLSEFAHLTDHNELTFIRPKEIENLISDIEEIDLNSFYSYELYTHYGDVNTMRDSKSCKHYSNLFSGYIAQLEKIQEKTQNLPDEAQKTAVTNLLNYAWKHLINSYHNFGITKCGSIIGKKIDMISLISHWRDVKYIERIIRAIEYQLTNEEDFSYCDITCQCGDIAFINNNFCINFSHRGGRVSNLYDLKTGKIYFAKPNLNGSKDVTEPSFGLMYDIIAKKYSGQYHLFQEWYASDYIKDDKGDYIIFTKYANKDVILKKTYSIPLNSKQMQIKYDFYNETDIREGFTIYNLLKFDFGASIDNNISKKDLKYRYLVNNGEKVLELNNVKDKTAIKVHIDKSAQHDVEEGFKSLDISIRRRISPLKINEQESYEINFMFD